MILRLLLLSLVLSVTGCAGNKVRTESPPAKTEPATDVVTTSIAAPESTSDWPTDSMILHLVGGHPMKADPSHQTVANHYCRQVNPDFTQCALFDSHSPEALLTGLEYIISDKLYSKLTLNERQYWHPHNYEILSGQLVAPGMAPLAEKELMRDKLNSYGKTFHFNFTASSDTGMAEIPMGPPMLAWSFNRDGEARAGLMENAENQFGYTSAQKSVERHDLVPFAQPQVGVSSIAHLFQGPTHEIAGVVDQSQPQAGQAADPAQESASSSEVEPGSY